MTRPKYTLVASLLALFAEISKQDASNFWSEVDECPLLPSLHMQSQGSFLL